MIFVKKETEEIIEEICKNEKVKKYVSEKMVLSAIFFCLGIMFGLEIIMEQNEIVIGGLIVVFALWGAIEEIVEIIKLKKQKIKKEIYKNGK